MSQKLSTQILSTRSRAVKRFPLSRLGGFDLTVFFSVVLPSGNARADRCTCNACERHASDTRSRKKLIFQWCARPDFEPAEFLQRTTALAARSRMQHRSIGTAIPCAPAKNAGLWSHLAEFQARWEIRNNRAGFEPFAPSRRLTGPGWRRGTRNAFQAKYFQAKYNVRTGPRFGSLYARTPIAGIGDAGSPRHRSRINRPHAEE
jgi:hypothetical protein